MVNTTQRIDRLEEEIRAIPNLINAKMERIRSELNLTTQNLYSQINTITQGHKTMATVMSNLNHTIEKLSERLTNPYFINPDVVNPLTQIQQNTLPQNNRQITPTPVPFTKNHENANVAVEEGRGNWRNRKLDLPAFYGEDSDGWILQAERYSTVNSLSEKEKIEFQEKSKEKRSEGGGACGCAWFRAWRFNRRRAARRLLFGKPRWRWRKKTRLAFSRKRRGKEEKSEEEAKVVLGEDGRVGGTCRMAAVRAVEAKEENKNLWKKKVKKN
ncbi:unnamed protein product [Amaranthus hypochondriacus]